MSEPSSYYPSSDNNLPSKNNKSKSLGYKEGISSYNSHCQKETDFTELPLICGGSFPTYGHGNGNS